MGLLFTTSYVGLDVGRYAVKGVKLRKKGKNTEVIRVTSVPYEKKVFDGESLIDEGEIVFALGKARIELGIDVEDYVVSAIFPDKILFRKLELPTMAQDQVLNAAKFQIVKELSLSPEEITVEVDINQRDLSTLDISSFIVKSEDVSKFNTLFFKANLPFPDILDAGYFKFFQLIEDDFFKNVSVVVFEDISSTYVELFKGRGFIAVDSVVGGTEGTEEFEDELLIEHYTELSDNVQNLIKMMLSRYSMADSDIERIMLISEISGERLRIWKKSMEELNLAREVRTYGENVNFENKECLPAYSLALRGVNENSKRKFLPTKNSKGKTA